MAQKVAFIEKASKLAGPEHFAKNIRRAEEDLHQTKSRAEELHALRQQEGDASTLDALLAKHVREYEHRRGLVSDPGHGRITRTGFTHPSGRLAPNPFGLSSSSIGRPIAARALSPGGQHPGRVLRGTVVSPPAVMHSAQFLLRDERGSIVPISVYNALSVGKPQTLKPIPQKIVNKTLKNPLLLTLNLKTLNHEHYNLNIRSLTLKPKSNILYPKP